MHLLAHHLELQHIPVLAILFVAGFAIGWQNIIRFIGPKQS